MEIKKALQPFQKLLSIGERKTELAQGEEKSSRMGFHPEQALSGSKCAYLA